MARRSLSMDSSASGGSNTLLSLTSLLHAALIEEQSDIFPFLNLPPELRNMIYHWYMSGIYNSVNKAVGRHVNAFLMDGELGSTKYKPPKVRKLTPDLLLVSRQIHYESLPFLRRETLVFDHGLMDFRLSSLIGTFTLRNITSIKLTHSGHNILDGRLRMSFVGHQRLVFSLVKALRDYGHSLKYLELHFTSPQLKWHVENCWGNRTTCDMKRWLVEIVDCWCQVRGIREVKILGWLPEDLQTKMLSFMQSDFNPLVKLPMNVINRIAAYTADFSGVSKAVNKANRIPYNSLHGPKPIPMSTPGILLADRSLNRLFAPAIGHQPLVLDLQGAPRYVMDITTFLRPATANGVSGLHVHIRDRGWISVIEHLARYMRNSDKLESFHLHFDDNERPRPSRRVARNYPDTGLVMRLDGLRYLHNIKSVTFGGDLANPEGGGFKYLEGLKAALMSPTSAYNAAWDARTSTTLHKIRRVTRQG